MLSHDNFRSFIQEHSLFDDKSRVLLAVSGGKDSVLMAHLFNASGIEFGIAHCNFKLRGQESDSDELFIADLAKKFNVPFHNISFNTKLITEAGQISTQMAARKLRYAWFEEIRTANKYDVIALAHHKNDSAETVLLNLIRGTGISGMHGILPKRGRLVRPMLFLNREEINEIVLKENIDYREDSSNSSLKYTRNKIRLEIIPKLKELNPRLEQTFEENSRRFSEIESYFKQEMESLRNKLFITMPSGDISIDLKNIKALNPTLSVLFELFRPFDFNNNVLEDLKTSWNGIPGKVFHSATHILLIDRKKLILRKHQNTTIENTLIYEDDTSIYYGHLALTKRKVNAAELHLSWPQDAACLDAALLVWPLKLRPWKGGDSFYPLGMKGKKKLSDFFINNKVPLTEKKQIPILENGNGDILWIAGYQSDERYKITSQSEKVIIFEVQK